MTRPGNLANPRWPVSLDNEFERLWERGLTITEIAQMLSTARRQISRNAVAGRRRRLRLPERGSPIQRRIEHANDDQPMEAVA